MPLCASHTRSCLASLLSRCWCRQSVVGTCNQPGRVRSNAKSLTRTFSVLVGSLSQSVSQCILGSVLVRSMASLVNTDVLMYAFPFPTRLQVPKAARRPSVQTRHCGLGRLWRSSVCNAQRLRRRAGPTRRRCGVDTHVGSSLCSSAVLTSAFDLPTGAAGECSHHNDADRLRRARGVHSSTK